MKYEQMKYTQRNDEIRRLYCEGETCGTLAAKYDLSRQRIAMIIADLPKHFGGKNNASYYKVKADEIKQRRQARQETKDRMIRLYEAGMTQESLAGLFGVAQTQISRIVAGHKRAKLEHYHILSGQIMALKQAGLTQEQIAAKLFLHQTTVSVILRSVK